MLHRQITLSVPGDSQPSYAEFYQYIWESRNRISRCEPWGSQRGINETGTALCRSSRQIQLRRCRRSFGVSITFRQARLKMFPPSHARRPIDRCDYLGLSWCAGRHARGKCDGPRGRRRTKLKSLPWTRDAYLFRTPISYSTTAILIAALAWFIGARIKTKRSP